MHESILITHTRNLLQQRPRNVTYDKIAQDTGLSVRWLTQLATYKADCVTDFGTLKVETLYTYLSGKRLEL